MKIGIVASLYDSKKPSGENRAVIDQAAALRRDGHTVIVYSYPTTQKELIPINLLRAGVRTATGFGRNPAGKINSDHVDLIHIHNLFPNFGSRWLFNMGIPVVATLHNFRGFCAQGNFLLNGETCFRCIESTPFSSVGNSCYRNSAIKTIPLALSSHNPLKANPLLARPDRLIALNKSRKTLLERLGMEKDRLTLIPNFSSHEGRIKSHNAGDYWVIIGRVSGDKGSEHITKMWPDGYKLKVIGAVEGFDGVEVPGHVELLGNLDEQSTQALLASSRGLISFSTREGSPITVLNALASGKPVVAISNDGEFDWAAEYTDFRFSSEYQLRSCLEAIDKDWNTASQEALKKYQTTYSQRIWLDRTTTLYRTLIH